ESPAESGKDPAQQHNPFIISWVGRLWRMESGKMLFSSELRRPQAYWRYVQDRQDPRAQRIGVYRRRQSLNSGR
ncbi:MAG: hypothetical protein ACE5JX_21355, partial [Acidobacteriota bacterium]